jgi:hypothetical protein
MTKFEMSQSILLLQPCWGRRIPEHPARRLRCLFTDARRTNLFALQMITEPAPETVAW